VSEQVGRRRRIRRSKSKRARSLQERKIKDRDGERIGPFRRERERDRRKAKGSFFVRKCCWVNVFCSF